MHGVSCQTGSYTYAPRYLRRRVSACRCIHAQTALSKILSNSAQQYKYPSKERTGSSNTRHRAQRCAQTVSRPKDRRRLGHCLLCQDHRQSLVLLRQPLELQLHLGCWWTWRGSDTHGTAQGTSLCMPIQSTGCRANLPPRREVHRLNQSPCSKLLLE